MPSRTITGEAAGKMRDAFAEHRALCNGYGRHDADEVQAMMDRATAMIDKTAHWLALPGGEVPEPSAPGYTSGAARVYRTLSIRDTLGDSLDNTRIAEDASLLRLELMGQHALDVAPMALDAANSIQAENSLEKMLAHQLATSHELAMRLSARALECKMGEKSRECARYAAAAAKHMAAYQGGLVALARVRAVRPAVPSLNVEARCVALIFLADEPSPAGGPGGSTHQALLEVL